MEVFENCHFLFFRGGYPLIPFFINSLVKLSIKHFIFLLCKKWIFRDCNKKKKVINLLTFIYFNIF